LGVRLLELLRGSEHGSPREVHLVVSEAGRAVLEEETGHRLEDLRPLVDRLYEPRDLFAPIASGSYPVEAMVIIPAA